MSGSKSALRDIEAAIKAERYEDAVVQSEKILNTNPRNYIASIFLGYSLAKLERYKYAEEIYKNATKVKTDEPPAWQGLIQVYERRGNEKIEEYRIAVLHLAEIFQEKDEKSKCQDVINNFIKYAKANGTRTQYNEALELLLPTSPVFEFLESDLPPPADTYQQIAQNVEFNENERINQLIGERRTRLGAKIGQVTAEVKREVMSSSNLENLYTQIVNWSGEDEVRRQYEEKLIQRCLDMITVLQSDSAKKEERDKVWKLATGMVIIKHPFKLAWDITLEWKDCKLIEDLDVHVLQEYCTFFPTAGLTSVLRVFLSTSLSPFQPLPLYAPKNQNIYASDSEDDEDEGGGVSLEEPLTIEEQLLMITEGMSDSGKSILAHRLTGEYYQHLEEYESAMDLMRNGQRLIVEESGKIGLRFENSFEHITALLGTALVYHQSPKYHPEAKKIFENLLERDPFSTIGLVGIGLIYEEEEDYDAAIRFFDRVLEKEPSNIRIKTEAAWVKALKGDYITGKQELRNCLSEIDAKDLQYRDLYAQTQYRYGMCLWNTDISIASRKDRNGAYRYFLAALKKNMNFAPAYTILGVFYADYCNDKKRARKCFQKAFELSSSEVHAAERLARIFAEQGEWDLVEVIAQRVVDSGKIRPSPGSKKNGINWPHAALGVAELNKHNYAKSISSFQSALRIAQDDYHSWVGLGESYHNCGRYIAATKALQYALKLQADAKHEKLGETWFTKHMLANVKRELGNYDEAIIGYQDVLRQRELEYSVSIAMIQTLIEGALDSINKCFFGYAIERAVQAIDAALLLVKNSVNTFNLWKAIGDACSIFFRIQSYVNEFPTRNIHEIFQNGEGESIYSVFSEIDGVGLDVINIKGLFPKDESDGLNLTRCIHASILAYKRAIYVSACDKYAQPIAFYNLGWIEYQAHIYLCAEFKKRSSRYLKASIRCFKRSIELEAGNSQFWNALGVVTSEINPNVAQHSFIRSLYLNERNAHVWSNLGTLYLIQNDYLLAHEAFTRAQSTDPDFAHAWVGQGILAKILAGDEKEAHILFRHAMEISRSSSILVKRQYAQSSFDQLISTKAVVSVTDCVQILFVLSHLQSMAPKDLNSHHLATLFLEYVNNMTSAVTNLSNICNKFELDYELTESPVSLSRFALAKADLARCQLSLGLHDEAVESGETALQLCTKDTGDNLSKESQQKCRLSAYLTVGLANFGIGDIESAIQCFIHAIEESNGNPLAICLLAQILWARGDRDSRNSARSYLFDCIEIHPDHVQSIILLAFITLFDQDLENLEPIISSLHELRTTDNINLVQKSQIGDVLQGIALLSHDLPEQRAISEIQTDILLNPSQSCGWNRLFELTKNQHEAEMALKTALKAMYSGGEVDAMNLSRVFSCTGRLQDIQRAIMTAPWNFKGWNSLLSII